ncbi:MAG TPA: hypothetical protein VGF85_08840 [Opitutaceae bacterium]|jgi:multiple sugar transport system substrate-binding protein
MVDTPDQAPAAVRPVVLRGMTWNHSRGYLPLAATAQRFCELNPGLEIAWDRRSLKAFEESPIERLAEDYDLIVLDHPFVGHAAKHRPLVALDGALPSDFLADQAAHSVGASHASYSFGGRQWALAVDAAAPIAFWREDLVARLGLSIPRTWDETLELARRGHVEVPAAPVNCLMNFYSLCAALGEEPFASTASIVSPDTGRAALERLRNLLSLCDQGCWTRNPIVSHERLAAETNTRLAYCPLAYGYSNYFRPGYADHRLVAGEPPVFGGAPLRTVLGGTGLAVSALRPHRDEAVAFARFSASGAIQETLYAQCGGQPGHRRAWVSGSNNAASGSYFSRTLPVLDRAYLRPRFCGYMRFQVGAGPLVHAALRRQIPDAEVLADLDALYRASLGDADGLS